MLRGEGGERKGKVPPQVLFFFKLNIHKHPKKKPFGFKKSYLKISQNTPKIRFNVSWGAFFGGGANQKSTNILVGPILP